MTALKAVFAQSSFVAVAIMARVAIDSGSFDVLFVPVMDRRRQSCRL